MLFFASSIAFILTVSAFLYYYQQQDGHDSVAVEKKTFGKISASVLYYALAVLTLQGIEYLHFNIYF